MRLYHLLSRLLACNPVILPANGQFLGRTVGNEFKDPTYAQRSPNASFQEFHPAFRQVIGNDPRIELALENNAYPFAHEAAVYISSSKELFVTSNRILESNGRQITQIPKRVIKQDSVSQEEINPDILMANGGTNYENGVLFCSQGTMDRPGGLVYMDHTVPYKTTMLIGSFYGRPFNSPNDVVIGPDGSIWFTDPIYGNEQGFRPAHQLPGQVYGFDRRTKSIRVVADGLGRPNGIAFLRIVQLCISVIQTPDTGV